MQRPWQDLLEISAMQIPAKDGDGDIESGKPGDCSGDERPPVLAPQKEDEEQDGKDFAHRGNSEEPACECIASAQRTPTGCNDQKQEKNVELPIQQIAMEREAASEDQSDAAIRQSGDRAQQPAEWNQEDEIREYPQMLRGKRRQACERPHHERGKRRDRHQSDNIALNSAVVLFTLKPYPFVLARGVEALMHQPG
jgi:hypothetical protein